MGRLGKRAENGLGRRRRKQLPQFGYLWIHAGTLSSGAR
jgi:hypothetical protein